MCAILANMRLSVHPVDTPAATVHPQFAEKLNLAAPRPLYFGSVITHVDLAQLASAPVPFNRDGWIFELKHDGFRVLAAHRKGRAELTSRRGNDFADRFPEIATALLQLPPVVLDSELVILKGDGRSDFERLWRRSRLKRATWIKHSARSAPACLFAF